MSQRQNLSMRRLGLALSLWGILGISGSAMAQDAFVHRQENLYRLDLVTDGAIIPPVLVGSTGIGGIVGSMAEGPDGRLYAAGYRFQNPDRLYAIDPATAEATEIGELDFGDDSALGTAAAFDDDGGLWVLVADTLYSVDPATAATTAVASGLENLSALAFHGGVLYCLVYDPVADTWALASLDATTGDVTPIVDVEGVERGSGFWEVPEEMDFDAAGGLWIAINHAVTAIDPPSFHTVVLHLDDPFSGDMTSRSWTTGADWYPALAVQAPVLSQVDVPALPPSGLLILASLLAFAAVSVLRRVG